MDKQALQRIKLQLNEIRGWFYVNAEKTLGVDITGIPLPRIEPTVSGGFQAQPFCAGGSYDYMEPTAYDLLQKEKYFEKIKEQDSAPPPKIYAAMGKFLNAAVQYMELKQDIADGESVSALPGKERNLTHALREVEQAALVPPFPEVRGFVENVAHHARIAHLLVTSDRAYTVETAEFKLAQQAAHTR